MPTATMNPAARDAGHEARRRYPLQMEIATVFTVLITILGVSLVWYNYSRTKEVVLIGAHDLFARITQQTTTNVHRLYNPAEVLVEITAELPLTDADNLTERKRWLNYFFESLRQAEHIASIYVGYGDGEFFLVRALRGDRETQQTFGAPETAAFVVNSIETNQGNRLQTFYFYADDGSFLRASEPRKTTFDPRQRPWYQMASETDKEIATEFYVFHSTNELGVTIAQKTFDGTTVIAADLTLAELSTGLATQKPTPSTKIVAFSDTGSIIAAPGYSMTRDPTTEELQPAHLSQTGEPVLEQLYKTFQAGLKQGQLRLKSDDRHWLGSISTLPVRGGSEIYLALLAPADELLGDIIKVRTNGLILSFALLLLAIGAAWWIAKRIARSLRALAAEAQRVRELKLDKPIAVRSHIMEVDDLAITMSMMKASIEQFVELSKALSAEKDFDRLLENILSEAKAICGADAGAVLLYDEEKNTLTTSAINNDQTDMRYGGASGNPVPYEPLIVNARDKTQQPEPIEAAAVIRHTTNSIDDIERNNRFDFSHVRHRYAQNDYRCVSFLQVPLTNRQGEMIGILELVNARDTERGEVIGFKPEVISFVEAFSSQAAITIDNRRLIKAQKDLLDAFIQLIASAIDAKSPYTSGHCQRVPELARMLAEIAHASETGSFKNFRLNDDEWYELHIASWLHDCGKVTTPEYVVDKATKLECVYNRLHEIRMRFEVLLRDAEVEYLKALVVAGAPDDTAKRAFEKRCQQLQDDFAFVAECNVGGEFMAPERVERLKAIGTQTWLRHFDDRVGLSHDEITRKQRTPAAPLPARETLLTDKEEHIVPRDDDGKPFGDNPHGFRMEVPQHAYNYGEIYNLGIARGTLSAEDRFKINEHIVQTIILLNKLPFPKELRRVPSWAGNHHETLNGTGYPRGLTGDALSIPERIMAVADIFEALTASDRPYKKAKTLSESLKIMSFMRNDGHICPDLFDLFLASGVYRTYAEQFLLKEQIDDVDIGKFMSGAAN